MNQPIPFPRDLSQKIQTVANQYQCQLILRQWGRFGASTFAVLLLFTGLLYAADSIGLSRLALLALWGMVESAMFYYFLVFQAKKPVALDQIALYIEENHPELENRLLSAIAFQQGQTQGSSQWMLEQFFQQTEEVIRPISLSDILETEVLTKFVLVGAGTFGLCFLLLTAFHRVWLPASITSHQPEGTTAALPAFSVEPGSTRVRVGDSVIVVCRIQEPQETATLQWRAPQGQWKDESMQPGASVHESYYIFPTVQQTIEYQVAWGRHRSETFTLTAWQPPQVQALDVTYSPPAYLAQEPHTVPNSAGISALEGTRVALQVHLNKEVETALLIFNEGTVLPLRPLASNRWTAEWELQHSGSFVIQLIDTEGQENEVQAQYPIQVEPDRPPTITLSFPNRDLEVNALEEVPFIFTMQDDHGMTGFGLAYEIAGRPPVSIPLHEPHALPKAATGTTTLYLEDLQLAPGDLITWNVWATDQKPGRAETETMSDPYFLEIRPFKTLYQEAISNAGQSSEGQNQGAPGSEAASQKDVVIAIWNLRRDSSTLNELQFNEKRAAITEAERAILQNTAQADAAAVSALQQRTLVESLQQTIDALDNTTHADPSPSLTRAYSHAQEAYRLLLAMRPDTVSIQQQLAQGQEGQTQAAAQRPDIQALESTRRRNVYEEERRTQQTLEQTDDTLSKIKELAARQQSINDEMAALISELQKEEDAEALRRRLERLQEEAQRNLERLDETNRSLAANDLRDPNVRDAMQELNETRQWMNRSLNDLRGGQVQSARNAGIRAADSLQTIEEELNQFSREMAANRLADLQTQMQTLQEQQRHIQDQLQQLIEKQETPTLTLEPQEDPNKTALLQQKEALAQQFLNTLNQAGDLAQRAEQSQPVASRLLNDWLRETSQRGIAEDMRRERSLPAIHYGAWDSAREIEETIQRKLQDSAHALEPIAEALIGSDLEGMQKAYEAMQRLLTMQPDPPTPGPIHDATETAPSPMQADTTISSVSSSQETGETAGSTTGASSSSIGNTTGNRASPHDTSAPNSGDVTTNEAHLSTTQRSVATGWNRGAFDPTAMDRFFGEDPRDGLDMVRNAEQWLPQGNPLRDRLSEIRENIETMRGQSKRESQPPRFDLFVEQIANPLVRTTEQLGDEISKKLAEDAFVLVDEQSVPPQYQDTVADYFKAIAEAEPAP